MEYPSWKDGALAPGSWKIGSWGVPTNCTPYSPGECWDSAWCQNSWKTGSWCPTSTPQPSAVPAGRKHRVSDADAREVLKIILEKRRREDEEFFIL